MNEPHGLTDGHGRARLNPQNPWPGLKFYDEASRRYFRGRRKEAAVLLRMVQHSPLTLLWGKSGLGKSSLLRAGLFPLLRAEHFLPVWVRTRPVRADRHESYRPNDL